MNKIVSKIGLIGSLIPLFFFFAHLVFEEALNLRGSISIILMLSSVVLAVYITHIWKNSFDDTLLFGIGDERFEGVRRSSISIGCVSAFVVLLAFFLAESELFDDEYIILIPGVIALSFILFSSLVCLLFWSLEGFQLNGIEKNEEVAIEADLLSKEKDNALSKFILNKRGLLEIRGNSYWTIFSRLVAASFGVVILASLVSFFDRDKNDSTNNKELLNKIVMQAKKHTPMSVAPQTTLVDVSTDGHSLTYKYQLSDLDSNDWTESDMVEVGKKLKEAYRSQICSDKAHYKYLQRGIVIRVDLVDEHEQSFIVINLKFLDCLDPQA